MAVLDPVEGEWSRRRSTTPGYGRRCRCRGTVTSIHQVHPGMEHLPLPLLHPAPHRAGTDPGVDGLGGGQPAGLPDEGVVETHPRRIADRP